MRFSDRVCLHGAEVRLPTNLAAISGIGRFRLTFLQFLHDEGPAGAYHCRGAHHDKRRFWVGVLNIQRRVAQNIGYSHCKL